MFTQFGVGGWRGCGSQWGEALLVVKLLLSLEWQHSLCLWSVGLALWTASLCDEKKVFLQSRSLPPRTAWAPSKSCRFHQPMLPVLTCLRGCSAHSQVLMLGDVLPRSWLGSSTAEHISQPVSASCPELLNSEFHSKLLLPLWGCSWPIKCEDGVCMYLGKGVQYFLVLVQVQ